jgi:calcineurin-like phosphoesterase family protein
MQNTYFFSDPHFGHRNIVKSISKWEDTSSCRNFESIEEHDQTIIDNINRLVKQNDVVYCLGDWSFGPPDNVRVYRNQIKCKNLHLILGNHDKHIRPKDSPFRGCFSSVNDVLQFSLRLDGLYAKTKFFLSHYSHQVWPNHHHHSIHLFGHSHGSLQGLGRSMDVGLDCHNFNPFHLDEIMYFMKDVNPHFVDHHTALND